MKSEVHVMPTTIITKEYLDSLPEETILLIRDYIWNRFGFPSVKKPGNTREAKSDSEAALPFRL